MRFLFFFARNTRAAVSDFRSSFSSDFTKGTSPGAGFIVSASFKFRNADLLKPGAERPSPPAFPSEVGTNREAFTTRHVLLLLCLSERDVNSGMLSPGEVGAESLE